MLKTRTEIVKLAKSWIGKNEADGSHKSIIDIYNSYLPHPRGYKLKYTDSWCAGTVSALAIKLGYTDIVPVECSCYYLIEKAKKMGIWIENENRTPEIGELVLYDWDDGANYGTADNKGTPDHVGIVSEVNKENKSFKVIEGNYRNAVKVRVLNFNDRYLRGYISPKYDNEVVSEQSKPSPNKSVTEIAKEVIDGKWGNLPERKTKLEKAGYNYAEVQNKVNNLLSGAEDKITKVAQEVIEGKWGVGVERKQRLTAANYNYTVVQKRVNELLKQK